MFLGALKSPRKVLFQTQRFSLKDLLARIDYNSLLTVDSEETKRGELLSKPWRNHELCA